MAQIRDIYHSHHGVDGYRSMTVYLARRGYDYSFATVHKYMKTELVLHSIVRPKKPDYEHRKPHKVFENDRSVVASITDRYITSDLAIRTLQKALDSQPVIKGEPILHSNQSSQYTSKAFVKFCKSVHITQSMSKAGYPYDNAPMERYFNTLKNECTNLYEFKTEEALYRAVEEFAYVSYNHVRPHSFNNYRTPYQARIAL